MPYVTVYYQGHKVEYVPLHESTHNRKWTVEQNGETFHVRESHGERTGTYLYDLYRATSPGSGRWLFQESDITSLDAVARVIVDTVYV
jgi:hypothetical protein